MASAEFTLQKQVADYVRMQYPRALFRSDLIALGSLKPETAVMMKQMQCARGWPDLIVYETIMADGDIWTGLAMELKVSTDSILTRSGSIKAGKLFHALEQQANLSMLNERGFVGGFYFGFEDACQAIDNYFKGKFDWNRAMQMRQLCLNTLRANPRLLVDERLDPFVARYYERQLDNRETQRSAAA